MTIKIQNYHLFKITSIISVFTTVLLNTSTSSCHAQQQKNAIVKSRQQILDENMRSLEQRMQQFGVDPSSAQMMKDALQKLPDSRITPSQSTINFMKQQKQANSITSKNPPADFPVPIFKGPNSQYAIRQPMSLSNEGQNSTIRALTITTNEPAGTISAWYRSALAQAGWKVFDPFAAAKELSRNPEIARVLPGGIPQPRHLTAYPGLASRAGIKADDQVAAEKKGMRASIQITQYSQKTEVMVSVVQQ
jgi:hypothetical protein